MYNTIIFSSCLFGSIYIFSKSLDAINKQLIENKKIPREVMLINCLTCIFTGSIFVSIHLLHLCAFKTPIIDIFSWDFYEFYSLEYIFLSYYKHLLICSYNIRLV